jgi:hypothetical protein
LRLKRSLRTTVSQRDQLGGHRSTYLKKCPLLSSLIRCWEVSIVRTLQLPQPFCERPDNLPLPCLRVPMSSSPEAATLKSATASHQLPTAVVVPSSISIVLTRLVTGQTCVGLDCGCGGRLGELCGTHTLWSRAHNICGIVCCTRGTGHLPLVSNPRVTEHGFYFFIDSSNVRFSCVWASSISLYQCHRHVSGLPLFCCRLAQSPAIHGRGP